MMEILQLPDKDLKKKSAWKGNANALNINAEEKESAKK